MAELKAKVVETEEKSIQEKEEAVQEKATSFDEETGMYKVNLNEPPKTETDAVQEQETKDGVLRGSGENEEAGEEVEVGLQEVREEEVEAPVLEEITDDETDTANETGVDGSAEDADTAPEQEEILQEEEAQAPSVDLPENIQDLVKFMNETGGSIEDYARLNADYSNVDDDTLLVEYYKQTKPNLGYEEIQFLMEDKF